MAEVWDDEDRELLQDQASYNKGWDEGSKQSRAEVLAATIKAANATLCPILNGIGPGLIYVADAVERTIRNLQPAAKDLEELLREAEAKGLRLSCIGVDDRLDSHNHQQACACCRRIAELEKVRASEVKG